MKNETASLLCLICGILFKIFTLRIYKLFGAFKKGCKVLDLNILEKIKEHSGK